MFQVRRGLPYREGRVFAPPSGTAVEPLGGS